MTDSLPMDETPLPEQLILELQELIEACVADSATPEQISQLDRWLIEDERARSFYVRYAQTLCGLKRWGSYPLAGAKPTKSPVLGFLGGAIDYVNHSRILMFSLVTLLVTGWFAFQLGSLMLGRARPGDAQVAKQPAEPNSQDVSHLPGGSFANNASPRQSDSVAFMTTLIDCHWRVVPRAAPPASAPAPGDADTVLYNGEPFHVGSELSAGQQLDLVRGLAEITFRSGARIVLNGPAHFTVGSPLGGKLQIGKLTARVPHDAHGFTVNTPAGKVVDLGTEFGVAVAANHTMDVEVFVGEVAVDASPADQKPGLPAAVPTKPQKLTAGHAAHVEPGKAVADIPLDPKRFVRGLGPREDPHVAQAAYLDFVRSLKPAVWFRMEGKDTDRVLHDEMSGPDAKLNWDGPGNPFVAGRVGKGLWLRGSELKDCAIVPNYPQAEHAKLSVAAWVYTASFPHEAYCAVCNWADSVGQGQFFLGLEGDRSGTKAAIVADINLRDGQPVSLVDPDARAFQLNEWQHIAFTTDGTTLRLYRQGHEVGAMKRAGLLYPVRLHALGIGVKPNDAGTAAGRGSPVFWDGKLDEIAIFNDVLTADDIRKLAAAPPQ